MKPSDFIERGWCQNTSAKSANETPVAPDSKDAVCWCSTGAIQACGHSREQRRQLWLLLFEAIGDEAMDKYGDIPSWNDDPARTKEEVLAAFRKAGL